jgi:hypothetical protein
LRFRGAEKKIISYGTIRAARVLLYDLVGVRGTEQYSRDLKTVERLPVPICPVPFLATSSTFRPIRPIPQTFLAHGLAHASKALSVCRIPCLLRNDDSTAVDLTGRRCFSIPAPLLYGASMRHTAMPGPKATKHHMEFRVQSTLQTLPGWLSLAMIPMICRSYSAEAYREFLVPVHIGRRYHKDYISSVRVISLDLMTLLHLIPTITLALFGFLRKTPSKSSRCSQSADRMAPPPIACDCELNSNKLAS